MSQGWDSDQDPVGIKISLAPGSLSRGMNPDPVLFLDPDPVCPERLDPDPDPVCPERLDPDPDPVNIRPDPQP